MPSNISQDKQLAAYRRSQSRAWRAAGGHGQAVTSTGHRSATTAPASQELQTAKTPGMNMPLDIDSNGQLSAYRRAHEDAWSRGMDPRSAKVPIDHADAVVTNPAKIPVPGTIDCLARPYEANFQDLPNDVLDQVLNRLDYVSATRLGATCKELRAATRDVLTAGIPRYVADYLRSGLAIDALVSGRATIERAFGLSSSYTPQAVKGLKESAIDAEKFIPVSGYHHWAAGITQSLWGKNSESRGGLAATYVGCWAMMPALEPVRLAVHAGVAVKRLRKAGKIERDLTTLHPEQAFRVIDAKMAYAQADRRKMLSGVQYADIAQAMVEDPASLIRQAPHPATPAEQFQALDAKQQAEHKYNFPGGLNNALWSPDSSLVLQGHPYRWEEVHGMAFKKKSRF